MVSISKIERVRGLPRLRKPDKVMCKQYQMGKMTKSSFKRKTYSFDDILELVHTDLCGPIRVQSYYVDKYFILFVDDLSIMMVVMILKDQSHVFQMFK